MVRVGNYDYQRSTRYNKKLMTNVQGRIIHFGEAGMRHFKDRTTILSRLDHGDVKKRDSYLARSAAIRDGKGNLTMDNPLSANYHSRRVLW
jgi:hypothetical protein